MVWGDTADSQWLRPWLSLFRGLPQWTDIGSYIDYEKFKTYYTMFTIEFQDEPFCRDSLSIKKMCPVTLNIEFTDNQNEVLKVYLFSISTEEIQITSQRTVMKNFIM